MNITLNPIIASYIEAGNSRNVEAFLECFAPDAIVVDESRTRNGLEEIEEWYHETRNQYDFTAKPLRFDDVDGETHLVCTVSGNFPGSPVDLSYSFLLSGDKIQRLTIE